MQVLVMDLDDTLYQEIDFVKSGFSFIAKFLEKKYNKSNIYNEMLLDMSLGKNVFLLLMQRHSISENLTQLLDLYRSHNPNIALENDIRRFLEDLLSHQVSLGLITDGRSITQRNKISALGLNNLINDNYILISEEFGSEKPHKRNFQYFMDLHPNATFTYLGDNTQKDFLAPNSLGWNTVCLQDKGFNIHHQRFDLPEEYLPQKVITKIADLVL